MQSRTLFYINLLLGTLFAILAGLGNDIIPAVVGVILAMYIPGFLLGAIEKLIFRKRSLNEIMYRVHIIALILTFLMLFSRILILK